MNKFAARFRNVVLGQSDITNIIRIFVTFTLISMVLLLISIWSSASDNRRVLSNIQSLESYISNIYDYQYNLDKNALLYARTKYETYLNLYIEISSKIYKSSYMDNLLEHIDITANERTLIQNALLEIDNVIASDMYAINLIYLSSGKDFINAYDFQKEFPLKEDVYNLSLLNKWTLGNDIILESFDRQDGSRYSQFLYEFDKEANSRLNYLFEDSQKRVDTTIFLMLIYTIFSVILLSMGLRFISHYINKPIMQYTKILENMESPESFARQLTPSGTRELKMMADILNNSNKRMNTLLKVYAYCSSITDNYEDTIKKILSLVKSEYKLDNLLLMEIYNKQKFKLFLSNGYTKEFDEKIAKSNIIPVFIKRIRNLNYIHIKLSNYKEEHPYNFIKELGFSSLSAFPLKSRDKDKRILVILSKKEEQIDIGIITLMALISQHMSILFENLKLYGSLFQQLQDRVQAQSEMKKAKEEAEKANTAKTQFLANISHEIRTPLTSILGYSDILSAMITDEKQLGYVKTISSAGNLLLQLINDVLDMSKIEAGVLNVQYYSFSPRIVFREVEQLLHAKILSKGIEFIYEIDDNVPEYIMLSETYLRQILINIVGNAVKFTGKGYVKLKAYAHFKGSVNRDVFDLIIEITDTGIGIEPDSIYKIFQPFTQQSGQNTRKYEGSGLGLTISNNLVNVMDGNLSVVSTPGYGSAFTVVFNNVTVAYSEGTSPLSEDEEDIVFDKSIAAVDEWLSGYTVLKDILEKLGVKVIPLQSLYELTEASTDICPAIIIVDYDDETLVNKYKSIMSFSIFNNACLLIVKKAGAEAKILDNILIDDFISRPFIMADIRKTLKKYLYFKKADRQDSYNMLSNFDDANVTYELKQIIINEYVPQIESFYGAIKLSGVLEFANKLVLDGTNHKCGHLSELGQRLIKSAQNYNMSDIRHDLNKIGKFISFVKELPL